MIQNSASSNKQADLTAVASGSSVPSGQEGVMSASNSFSDVVQTSVNWSDSSGGDVGIKSGKNSNKQAQGGQRKRKQQQEGGKNTRQRTAAEAALASILSGM